MTKKFSGFCMSALLVVICLWINAYYYPNAFLVEKESQTERNKNTFVAPNETLPEKIAPPISDKTENASTDESTEADAQTGIFASTQPRENQATYFPASAQTPTGSNSQVAETGDATDLGSENPASLNPASFTRVVSDDEAPEPTPSPNSSNASSPDASDHSSNDELFPLLDAATHVSLGGVDARIKSSATPKTSTSSKPQGGKYVSIPSVEIDPLTQRVPNGALLGRVVVAKSAEGSFVRPRAVGFTVAR